MPKALFVFGAGGSWSLLAQLLARQGHSVWCDGDCLTDRALGRYTSSFGSGN